MTCPSADTLARFAQGLLRGGELDDFEVHLADCATCLRVVGEVAGQEELVGAPPAVTDDVTIVRRGASVGRYIVLDLLGWGGMGVVYTGYDPLLDRKVALKLLRPASGEPDASPDHGTARLLGEAKALARVSHPNVVAIYDVGTVGEQIFMAFERVEGDSLAGWLKTPRSWQQIRDAFVEAGRGLAAAHAAGVVHHDFKPDNVLVGLDRRIRVTDFGLAGAVLGTPGYMPPEVLAGERVDAGSDQFSFCVALYESLYAEKPFPSADLAPRGSPSVDRAPAAPRDARAPPARVRRALLRGLQRRPEDRFPDMNGLLEALQTDPLRRAIPFVAAGLGVSLVVAALAGAQHVAGAQAHPCQDAGARLSPIWNDARRAAARHAFEATGLPYAAEAWRTSEQILSGYASSWTAMRTEACEATHVRGEQSAEALDLRMACLDRHARDFGLLMEMLESPDAKVVENAVRAAQRLPPLAGCADLDALKRPQREPKDEAKSRRIEESRAVLARARALLAVGKADASRELAIPVVAAAHDLAFRPLEAEALFVLGSAQSEAGEYATATRSLHDAALAAEIGRDLPLEARAYAELAMVVGPIQREFDQGELFCAHVRACLEQIGGDDEIEAELMDVEAQLAYLAGHLDESLALSTQAIDLLERTAGSGDRRVEALRSQAGYVLADLDRFPEAVQMEDTALQERRRTLGAAHPDVAASLTNLALVHDRMGNDDAALAEFLQARDIWTAAFGPGYPNVGFAEQGAAQALMQMGRLDEARSAGDSAVETLTKGYGAEHPRVASALCTRGRIALERGALDEAQTDYERALALLQAPSSNPMRQGAPMAGLGMVLLARRRPREALVPLERAVQLLEQLEGYSTDRAEAHFALAIALWDSAGDRRRSVSLAKRALGEVRQLPAQIQPRRGIESWLAAHPVPIGEHP